MVKTFLYFVEKAVSRIIYLKHQSPPIIID